MLLLLRWMARVKVLLGRRGWLCARVRVFAATRTVTSSGSVVSMATWNDPATTWIGQGCDSKFSPSLADESATAMNYGENMLRVRRPLKMTWLPLMVLVPVRVRWGP